MRIDPDRWERLQALFHEALDRAPSERESFLDEHCGDAELRADVQALLDADEGAASVLDRDLPSIADDLFDRPLPGGGVIGPYRLIRPIGEGGMGIVYLAERADLQNRVAIKMLRDAWVSPARRERFASEQRTLAMLGHPSIARVLDAATLPDGTPYFVMEYVEGTEITRYCADRGLSTRDTLRLFREVCDAVRFAHQRAVIHRDLKPSNILVTDEGAVKLLDFGIARHLDVDGAGGDLTRTGQRLLTPAYAAPEQIRGEAVGAFTDVYALGVLLHELLTGCHPFRRAGQTAGQLEVAVLEEEPRRPSVMIRNEGRGARPPDASALPRSLLEELDVLCSSAMHRDTTRRYGSVEALARDVDHFLRGEPLEARQDTLGYRTSKFLRRNRKATIAGGLVGIALITLTAFYTIGISRERDRATLEAERAQQVSDYLIDLFETGDPYAVDADVADIRTLLARGEQRADELASQPEVHARMLDVLGRVETALSDYDRADSLLSRALTIRRQVDDGSLEVAETLTNLGTLHFHTGDNAKAEAYFREALAIRERELPANDADLATALDNLGVILAVGGDYGSADTYYRRALAIRRQRAQVAPEDLGYSLNNVAVSLYNQGKLEESEGYYREALDVEEGIYGDRNPTIATTYANLGRVLQDRGEFVEAESVMTRALRIRRETLGENHYETALSLSQLGGLIDASGDPQRARPYLEEALTLRERLLGPEHSGVATTLNSIGLLLYRIDDDAGAEQAFRRAVAIYRTALGERHRFTGIALANLASVEHRLGDPTSAEASYREAISILEDVHPEDHPELAYNRGRFGQLLADLGRVDEALALLDRSYPILLETYGPDDSRTTAVGDRIRALRSQVAP